MNQLVSKDSDSPKEKTEFEDAGEGKQLSIAQEFVQFIVENKAWWLVPIMLVLGLIGLIVTLSATGALPFIYAMF